MTSCSLTKQPSDVCNQMASFCTFPAAPGIEAVVQQFTDSFAELEKIVKDTASEEILSGYFLQMTGSPIVVTVTVGPVGFACG